MNWLLRTFLPYLVFGIIVVFQAEIRKVLAHLGKTPLPGRRSARSARRRSSTRWCWPPPPWPPSARAPSWSSSARWACAATSRPASRLDALVTYDLLISIFNPGTPLHDGAVIIQGNRVAAAACFLPLTVNPRARRASWAAATAPPSASPRTRTRWRSWCRRRRASSRWSSGGRIRRELDAALAEAGAARRAGGGAGGAARRRRPRRGPCPRARNRRARARSTTSPLKLVSLGPRRACSGS